MATFNSQSSRAAQWALVGCLWLAGAGLAAADEAGTKVFAARAGAEFERTQSRFQTHTNDATAAWEFARACFNFADYVTNDTDHAAIAIQGIAASRQAIACEPNSAPGHYYLGENLGQLARTETLGALKLVKEMERELKTAARRDGHFDYAGADRSLGLLYRDAPGWPVSIGSQHKAHEWLEQAAILEPGYPENHLNLAESYYQWHEPAEASRELAALDALWPAARTNLVGPAWESSWADWSARRETVRKQLEENSKPAGAPKH